MGASSGTLPNSEFPTTGGPFGCALAAVQSCGIGSCGAPRPSLAAYVMEMGPYGGDRRRRGASVGYALLVAWTIMVAGNHPGARALCRRGDARRALEAGGTSRRAAPAAVRDKLCISSARASWVMDELAQALQVNPAS